MSAAWILHETDCIFTGPSRLITQIKRAFPIQIMPPPVKLSDITIVQVWHERNNNDAGHRWLREQIREILQNCSLIIIILSVTYHGYKTYIMR